MLMSGIVMEVVKDKVRDLILIKDEKESTDFYDYRMNKYEVYQNAIVGVSLTLILISAILWALANIVIVFKGFLVIVGLVIMANYSSDD